MRLLHVFAHDPQFPFAPGAKPPAEDATSGDAAEVDALRNGVARTVLIQVIHYKWDNRYLGSVLKKYPQYFQGVCRVNPLDPRAPDHLSQLTEEGFSRIAPESRCYSGRDWIRGALDAAAVEAPARSYGCR